MGFFSLFKEKSFYFAIVLLINFMAYIENSIIIPYNRIKKENKEDSPMVLEPYPNNFLSKEENISIFLEYPLINNYMDQMIITVAIGSPPQDFNVLLDTGSNILWISDHKCDPCPLDIKKFKSEISTSLQYTDFEKTINYATGKVKGKWVHEKVGFPGLNGTDLKLLIADESEGAVTDGIVGFGYNTKSESSIIDTLYEKKIIESNMFCQIYNLNNTTSSEEGVTGTLLIGEYPIFIKEKILKEGNKDYLGSCNLQKHNNHWACQLKSIFYGQVKDKNIKKVPVLQDIIFDTGANRDIFTTQLFHEIVSNFFQEHIDSKICSIDQGTSSTRLLCKCDDLSIYKNINYEIGDWIIYIKPNEYFMKSSEDLCKSSFISLNGLNANLFGEPMLKLFVSIFNKQDDKFEFYGENMIKSKEVTASIQDIDEQSEFVNVVYDSFKVNKIIGIGFIAFVIILLIAVICLSLCLVYNYSKSRKTINNETINMAMIENK